MDKKKLLAAGRLPEETVPLPGVGTVKVRGLSRGEVLELRADNRADAEQERRYIAAAMLDPVLTEDEVEQWQKVARNDEFKPVIDAVYRLSGFAEGAQKSDVQSVPE